MIDHTRYICAKWQVLASRIRQRALSYGQPIRNGNSSEHSPYVAVCTCDWSVDSERWKWIETATQCSNIIALLVSRNLRLLPRAWGPGRGGETSFPSDQYQTRVFLYRHLHVAIADTLIQRRDEQPKNIPTDGRLGVNTSSPATQMSVGQYSIIFQRCFVPSFIITFLRFSQICMEMNCVNCEKIARRFWRKLAHKSTPKFNKILLDWQMYHVVQLNQRFRERLLHHQDSDITQSSEPCYMWNVLYLFVARTGTTLIFIARLFHKVPGVWSASLEWSHEGHKVMST
jgi:hypothetical protein